MFPSHPFIRQECPRVLALQRSGSDAEKPKIVPDIAYGELHGEIFWAVWRGDRVSVDLDSVQRRA